MKYAHTYLSTKVILMTKVGKLNNFVK